MPPQEEVGNPIQESLDTFFRTMSILVVFG